MTDPSATDVRFPEPDSEDHPDGWEYNPSSWSERFPLVGLALLGLGIAAYLSAFQLGLIRTIWDPFFGRGSEIILRSSYSKVLPIPDAALGALSYLLDAVTGVIGGRSR